MHTARANAPIQLNITAAASAAEQRSQRRTSLLRTAASSMASATSMSAIEAIWGPSPYSDSTWKRRTSK